MQGSADVCGRGHELAVDCVSLGLDGMLEAAIGVVEGPGRLL
jgi:hypothetical protein